MPEWLQYGMLFGCIALCGLTAYRQGKNQGILDLVAYLGRRSDEHNIVVMRINEEKDDIQILEKGPDGMWHEKE
jgi:hypothetical protein